MTTVDLIKNNAIIKEITMNKIIEKKVLELMDTATVKNLKKKFDKMVSEMENSSLAEFVGEIEELVDSCCDYVKAVTSMEYNLSCNRNRFDSATYRQICTERDKARRAYHNSLISKVSLCNRFAKKINVEPLFEGNENDRVEVADFAFQVLAAFFMERKL
jgi:tetrahydromethanopterin S-methyltransferase subunit H